MRLDFATFGDYDLILWLASYGRLPGHRRQIIRAEAEARRRSLVWTRAIVPYRGPHAGLPGWRMTIQPGLAMGRP